MVLNVTFHRLPTGNWKGETDVVRDGIITRLVRVGYSKADVRAKLAYTVDNQCWWHSAWDRYYQRRPQPN